MAQPKSRPHRHCMVVHNYYPIGEPRVQRQAEALHQAGLAVDVICLRNLGEPAFEVEAGIQIHRLPVRRDKQRGLGGQLLEYLVFFTLAFFRLTRLYLRCQYQTVQVHNLPDFLVFTALIPRLTGAKIILDLHDLMPEFFMSRFGDGQDSLLVRLVRFQERISCRFAHHVITVTEIWRQALIKRGVAPANCSVVMNVADERIFRHQPSEMSSNGRVHLIYHGTLTHRYGIDLVLQALARARAQVPDLRLTIHGRGEYLSELEHLVAELELHDAVHLSTRLLPMEELPQLLASADIGLVPYRRDVFTDGILPTKLMEYAALGLPVIAARTPAIETYFDGKMVAFFEAGDVDALAERIVRLSRDPDQRAELGRAISRFTEHYNWATQRKQYLALVTDLLKQSQ